MKPRYLDLVTRYILAVTGATEFCVFIKKIKLEFKNTPIVLPKKEKFYRLYFSIKIYGTFEVLVMLYFLNWEIDYLTLRHCLEFLSLLHR